LEAIQQRARKDRTTVSWFLDDFNLARAGNVAKFKSAALVFINSDSGEAYITVDGNEGDRYDSPIVFENAVILSKCRVIVKI